MFGAELHARFRRIAHAGRHTKSRWRTALIEISSAGELAGAIRECIGRRKSAFELSFKFFAKHFKLFRCFPRARFINDPRARAE